MVRLLLRRAQARHAPPRETGTPPAEREPARKPRRITRLLGEKNSLTGRASRALGWSFFSTAFTRLGLLGFGVLLARLLGPHQFGTAAVALVALLAVLSVNELGVSLAIVRWPGDPAEIAPTVSTISVSSSLLIYVGAFFAAPAFAAAMGAPAAASVIRVLALSTVTSGVVAVPAALLQRHFQQGKKMIADQAHGWLSVILSVILAWKGFGAMSIAVGQVAGALVGGILIVIFAPLPLRFGFDPSKARKLLGFGLPLAGSSLVVFLVANVDNFAVGHLLGATALGFYVLAWNLASWPVNMFSQPVRSVAPALFSRLQNDPAAMRSGFTTGAQLLGSITLPACLAICGAAVPLVIFMYGGRWAAAAPALFWLAILAALRIFFELSYDFFVVLAKSRVVFTVQLAWLIALIPALIAGARLDGIRGVAIAGLVVASVVVLPWYLYELEKAGIPLRTLAARLCLPIGIGVLVGFAAFGAAKLITSYFIALMVAGLVALAAIGVLCYTMRRVLSGLNASAQSESLPGETPHGPAVPGPPPAVPNRPDTALTEPLPIVVDRADATVTEPFPMVMRTPSIAETVPMPLLARRNSVPHPSDCVDGMPIYQQTINFFARNPVADKQDRGEGRPVASPPTRQDEMPGTSPRHDHGEPNRQQTLQEETFTW